MTVRPFLLSARGRGPPATRKMTELTNKKLLNLQEEYFMKKFIKKITHTAKSAVTCVKTAAVNSMSAVLAFNRRAVCSNAGEGYIDTAVNGADRRCARCAGTGCLYES